jgi:flagellar biosynthesis/type III secretory pathway protein FliH
MPNSQDQNQITTRQEDSLEPLGEEYKKGFEAGKAEAEEELRSQSEQVDSLLNALSGGHCDTMGFYNPLKILAVKIAEAVLKTDLEESKASIEKISQELIDSFSLLKDEAVSLFLSPEDLNKLSAEFKDRHSNIEFIEDRKLSKGSSYAEMNDRLVTDFSEERLAKVIQQVLPHDKG